MKFQGRGPVFLAVRNADGEPGKFIEICPDVLTLGLTTESFEHINKCGPVDVPDYRGIQSVSGQVTLSFTDLEDLKYAIAVLGTITAAEVSPTAVTNEELAGGVDLEDGDVVFLGNGEQNRVITSLVIQDSATVPDTLVVDTDYTLDAASGKVTFIGDLSGYTMPLVADYSHQNPQAVSLLSTAQQEYFVRQEFINKANANDPGSLELYKVRFDPPTSLDMLSDELQVAELVGTVLADDTKEITDTEFGQFGRRIL